MNENAGWNIPGVRKSVFAPDGEKFPEGCLIVHGDQGIIAVRLFGCPPGALFRNALGIHMCYDSEYFIFDSPPDAACLRGRKLRMTTITSDKSM